MSSAPIENEIQYRAARARITVLEDYLAAIADLTRRAAHDRAQNRVQDEDLRSLAPLQDAVADLNCTRERLLDAADGWQELVEYGVGSGRRAAR